MMLKPCYASNNQELKNLRIEELELQMGMIEAAKDAIAKTRGEV